MRTHHQALAAAGCVLSLMAPASAAQSSAAQADPQQPRTSVIAVETSRRPADPLDTRLSFQFTNSPAGDVPRVLTKAAALEAAVNFTSADTRTVLTFLCQSASCTWEFDDAARELRIRFKTP